MYLITKSEEETIELGKIIGENACSRDFLCLDGELGAGKTHLTKGIALGIGIDDDITSPTFTIVQEYIKENKKFYHFDAYRLCDEDELYAIGFDDYINDEAVIVMEWALNVSGALPEDRLEIKAEYTSNLNERKFTFIPLGESSKKLLEKIMNRK